MDSDFNASVPPMFSKIILKNTLQQAKLEIPSGFVSKYRNCLKSLVKLKIPNGNSWQVELSKVGEAVWFEKGWKEFADHNSLQYGHLLVFTYQPNSHFDVNIFDMSAVEIQYPSSIITEGNPSSIKDQAMLNLDPHFTDDKISLPQSDIQPSGGSLASCSTNSTPEQSMVQSCSQTAPFKEKLPEHTLKLL